MAATLTHRTRRALSEYRFMDVDHPLVLAWSDYSFARAMSLPCRVEKARLKRELTLELLVSREMEKAA